MLSSTFLAAAVALVAGVSAQGVVLSVIANTSTPLANSTAVSTVLVSSCAEFTATVSGTVVDYFCPDCLQATGNGIFTTYTTIYSQWCPTGLIPATYTITAPCAATGSPLPLGYVPPGFTVTTQKCPVCPHDTTAVITAPITTQAPAFTPVPAVTTPSTLVPSPAPACTTCHATTAPIIVTAGASSISASLLGALAAVFAAML
jgi:hypothetical protein